MSKQFQFFSAIHHFSSVFVSSFCLTSGTNDVISGVITTSIFRIENVTTHFLTPPPSIARTEHYRLEIGHAQSLGVQFLGHRGNFSYVAHEPRYGGRVEVVKGQSKILKFCFQFLKVFFTLISQIQFRHDQNIHHYPIILTLQGILG